jgi:hypothetical protein
MAPPEPREPRSGGALRAAWSHVREHPGIASVMLVCTLGGAALGFALLGAEWSVVRRIAGGAVAGAGIGLVITATRMIG